MKIFVLVSLLFIIPLHLLAHDTLQYTVRQYTDENGLPQNSVKSFAFDRSGFLWMITENGVVRFDGQNFRPFNKNQLALTSSRISWLLPDLRNGGLYAVTEKDQTIYMQDGQANLSNKRIEQLDGELHSQGGHYKVYNALGLPNIYASFISIDRYKMSAGKDRYFLLSRDSIITFQNGKMESSIAYKAGNYWDFILVGSRLYRLRDLQVTLMEDGRAQSTGELQGQVRWQSGVLNRKAQPKIYWNASSRQAFLVVEKCLYLIKPGAKNGLTTELLMRDFDYEANMILSIFYDIRYKRIFMGSSTRGLFVFTRKPFYTLRSGQSDADEVYYAQAPFGDDRALTPQGYVLGLHKSAEVLPEFSKRMKEDRTSMLIDHRRNIWVKHRNMLYCFDPTGKKLLKEIRFPHHVTVLYEDQHGMLFIGTRMFPGYRLNLKDKKAEPEIVYPAVKDLCYIQEEGGQRLWMGTSNGLYSIDRETGTVDSIRELTGKYIRSLYVRQEGEVWITTHEDGYFLFSKGKLIKMPVDKGNYLAYAHCILEDTGGFFWITTNKGLFQAARQDLLDFAAGKLSNPYYLYYDKHTGFNTNEFNGGCQPCGIKLEDGSFSLPSLNGLVVGNPNQLVPEVPDHQLFIDRIEIDARSVPLADTISMNKHFDYLRLFITTAYFGNPYNRQLDFSLVKDGNTANWLPLDSDGSIKLSSLASGTYEIRIRKSNGFGSNNHMVKSLMLVVPLAFYETTWFRILIVVLIIAGFFLYMRIKLRYIRRKNSQLEQKIDERTQALQSTLTVLQQSEENMRRQTRMQERLITAITHDIKTPLKYLTGAARRMFENTGGEKVTEDGKRNAHLIYETGYRMYHLTDNLLQYIKLNSSGINVVLDRISLYELVQTKLQIFSEIAAEQSTTIENHILPDTYIRSNHHLLGVVIHNLIDNAVKATFNGLIRVSASENAEEIIVGVEDNGFGMNPEMQEWCNAGEEAEVTDNGIAGKSGLGLIIVKDLVAQMQGRIRVGNAASGGTMVELIFRKQ